VPRNAGHLSAFFSGVDLLEGAALLLLLDLQEERAVDAGQNTTEGDGRADESVQFLVTTNGELQVARGDTLDLEILGGVAGQFEDFGSEVLKNSGHVDGSWGVFVSDGFPGEVQRGCIPLAPTRILFWVLFFKKRLTRPQGN
jgi:hypothetical protein